MNLQWSNMTYLDIYGNELFLPLSQISVGTPSFSVTGYNGATTDFATIFEFVSGANKVYVYIPFITNAQNISNPYIVDLQAATAPSNSLHNWDGTGGLNIFNFFDMTDYNQWYSITNGTQTVLINRFIYYIPTTPGTLTLTSGTSANANLNNVGFTSADAAITGQKLCYGSSTTGNVHIFIYSSKHI